MTIPTVIISERDAFLDCVIELRRLLVAALPAAQKARSYSKDDGSAKDLALRLEAFVEWCVEIISELLPESRRAAVLRDARNAVEDARLAAAEKAVILAARCVVEAEGAAAQQELLARLLGVVEQLEQQEQAKGWGR